MEVCILFYNVNYTTICVKFWSCRMDVTMVWDMWKQRQFEFICATPTVFFRQWSATWNAVILSGTFNYIRNSQRDSNVTHCHLFTSLHQFIAITTIVILTISVRQLVNWSDLSEKWHYKSRLALWKSYCVYDTSFYKFSSVGSWCKETSEENKKQQQNCILLLVTVYILPFLPRDAL